MATNHHTIGDLVRLAATFTNQAGAAVDPTTVVISVRDPAGTVTTPSVTKAATGSYYADYAVATAGAHHYRAAGTGANQGAEESAFIVDPSHF